MDSLGESSAPRRSRLDAAQENQVLARLVHSVRDYGIFALDPDGRVVTWNDGAERLTGFTVDEMLGQPISVFHLDHDLADGRPERELAIATASGVHEEEGWRLRKDGTVYWASVVLTAIRGDDGRLLGFGMVSRDLTDRKRGEDALLESEERFRLLVSGVSDYAIFFLNPDGSVASWNRGAERLKGYRAEEILGQHLSRFYSAEDQRADRPGQVLLEALAKGRWEGEGWRVRRDGTRFWASVVVTALYGEDGGLRGFAKVTRDLTDRKLGEDALRGVLERERRTAARLRELDRMKNDLVAVIAHDLRAPVGVIQGFLSLLVEDWSTLSEDEKLRLLGRAEARAASVGAFVDEVFDVARIEAGELGLQLTTFDPVDVVAEVVDDLGIAHPRRRVVVDVVTDRYAVGDPRRTWQVLSNLVGNATKFSPPGSPVAVSVRHRDDEIVVSVGDEGPGIPPEQHEQLFERFVRLPSSAGTNGSGIGLFIARSLVEAQGGRMWVESTPGAGSTFSFTLPAAPTAPTP